MTVQGWDPLFWQKSALFWPIRPAAEAFGRFEGWPSIEAYNLVAGEGAPVRFRLQPPRPRRRRRGAVHLGALYDARIVQGGWVPTRTRNWHDFFNMLVWTAFPRAKRALHARQHHAIAMRIEEGAQRLPPRRTRELDGLALLDEGGIGLLGEARWADAVEAAGEGARAEVVRDGVRRGAGAALLFGHALYESFFREGPRIYAMAQVLRCEALPESEADRVRLADERLEAALGVPGSFAEPERLLRVPLDERVLCA